METFPNSSESVVYCVWGAPEEALLLVALLKASSLGDSSRRVLIRLMRAAYRIPVVSQCGSSKSIMKTKNTPF